MPREVAREAQRPRVYVAAGAADWPADTDGVAPERAPRITVGPSRPTEVLAPARGLGTELEPPRTLAGKIALRCGRVVLYVLSLPFRGLRALYWAIDTDAKVRSRGEQTVGSVEMTKTDTQVHTDPETGEKATTYTHYVSYSFPADGETRRDQKKVGSLGNLKRGHALRVYYLPGGNRVDSALDWNPQVLASQR